MNDDLATARGLLFGTLLGVIIWALGIALIWWLFL